MAALTAFDPSQHSAEVFAGATLVQRNGFVLETDTSVLRFGSSGVGEGSPFAGLSQSQIDALLANPAALEALLNGLPSTSAGATRSSVSFYDGSITGLGLGAGVLLTSGDGVPPANNSSGGYSGTFENTTGPDTLRPALQAVVNTAFSGAGEVKDYSALSFQLRISDPSIKGVRFNVVYASEEFPEYTNSEFVDVAAVFVNGVNYALYNGGAATPLSVVGANEAAGNVRNNTGNAVAAIEYDGLYNLLSVVAPVNQGLNTISIGVADTGDQILDSGLFVSGIQATAFGGFGLANVVVPTAPSSQDAPGNQLYSLPTSVFSSVVFGASPSGDDVIDSGQGNAGVRFLFDASQLQSFSFDGQNLVLNTPFGAKSLFAVERVHFNDLYVAFDTAPGGHTFQAYAMLLALTGQAPTHALLAQSIQGLDASAGLGSFGNQLIQALAPNIGLSDLVKRLLVNLTGSTNHASDLVNGITALVGPGQIFATPGDLLAAASQVDQNIAKVSIVGQPLGFEATLFG